MTYDQYWYGDVWMVESFREAERLRQERVNREAHLQGMYIYDALLDVAPILHAFARKGTKARPYPNKPYKMEQSKGEKIEQEDEEDREKREEKEALIAKLYMQNMFMAGQNWGKK